MRVLISGSSGLVGTALRGRLREQGHGVVRLIRGGVVGEHDIRWDPTKGSLDTQSAEGADAVVSLGGASIANGRWNEQRKTLLRSSRINATRNLVGVLAKLQRRPRVFVSASAIGYYGSRGEEELREESPPGNDFLAQLTQEWELEASRAGEYGMRVVMLRFGVILAGEGGALPKMAMPFKLGVGGRIGSGRQWMSWVSLDDAVGLIVFALENEQARGPMNCVAPHPVRNEEFTRTLGRVLRRPAISPLPAFAARLAFGEMADSLLLASQRVVPAWAFEMGYTFRHAGLEGALRAALGKL